MKLKSVSIIQGGMGVYASTPFLAREVSCNGGLGTTSGVCADRILAHILQKGDLGGHYRRALEHFPFPEIAERVISTYYVSGGISPNTSYKVVPVFSTCSKRNLIELTICANFAFVWLSKEGHHNPVSINYLEKVRLPHLFSFVGAMLAGVDCITMGAGLPLWVPAVLDSFSQGKAVAQHFPVESHIPGDNFVMSFNPCEFFKQARMEMKRPNFLPIVSSDSLASIFLHKASGSVEGFVVELPTAGGHNAPPRGKYLLSEKNEPIYSSRDEVNFQRIADLGLPFWIGGSYASPQKLLDARALGASGIQAGSIFALCNKSGLDPLLTAEIRSQGFSGNLNIRTDVRASSTGFPIKVVDLDNTVSNSVVYQARKRICNASYLVTVCRKKDGALFTRCSAEPVQKYVRKGGLAKDTENVRCLCNGLLAASGLADPEEPPILTLGDDVGFLQQLMKDEQGTYTVAEAMQYLNGT